MSDKEMPTEDGLYWAQIKDCPEPSVVLIHRRRIQVIGVDGYFNGESFYWGQRLTPPSQHLKYQQPTAPGVYWARLRIDEPSRSGWRPVRVAYFEDILVVALRECRHELVYWYWGPEIPSDQENPTPPDDLEKSILPIS